MTDRLHRSLAAAIGHLEWFAIPHTVDQIIGLYSEALAGQTMRYRHGVSNDELLEAIRASGSSTPGGKGGHSDPTADAALRGQPDAIDDADGTLGAIDACLALLEDAARRLDHLGADSCSQVRWHPPQAAGGRQGRLSVVIARLHHATPTLDAAAQLDPDLVDELVRTHIAESAAWLHEKCTEIWRASRGEAMPVAVQRERILCDTCTEHGRDETPKRGTRCDRCKNFIRTNKGLRPTAKIVRWWMDHPRTDTPPRLILEARADLAEAKRKERKRGA